MTYLKFIHVLTHHENILTYPLPFCWLRLSCWCWSHTNKHVDRTTLMFADCAVCNAAHAVEEQATLHVTANLSCVNTFRKLFDSPSLMRSFAACDSLHDSVFHQPCNNNNNNNISIMFCVNLFTYLFTNYYHHCLALFANGVWMSRLFYPMSSILLFGHPDTDLSNLGLRHEVGAQFHLTRPDGNHTLSLLSLSQSNDLGRTHVTSL